MRFWEGELALLGQVIQSRWVKRKVIYTHCVCRNY